MIKLIIFDFDGVVADCKELHYQSLNKALSLVDPKYVITREEHISTFDGLSTKRKLELLIKVKRFPFTKVDQVYRDKQKFTMEMMDEHLHEDLRLAFILNALKVEGYKLYMASNAIRETVEKGLTKLGVLNSFDAIYSNEDVLNQKPHPQIYLKCMVDAGVMPAETVIVEDSKHGRAAALASGAHICGVDNPSDLSYDKLKDTIDTAKPFTMKWPGKDVTVLIPMAGAGSRFKQAGYKLPKPLIDVNGKPMIQCVVENLNINANFVFVVQKEHYENYNLGTILPLIAPGCKIVQSEGLTEGAACTTLLAKEFINNDNHLLIANSDQFLENFDSSDFMYNIISSDADGGIITFYKENDLKWSYAKLGDDGFICEVAEKQQISNLATIGIYYWKRGKDYVSSAEEMIKQNVRVRNEFYVCPTYNYLISKGLKIKNYEIKESDFCPLGTPEDLSKFLNDDVLCVFDSK